VVLAASTVAMDVVAVIAGYDLARAVLDLFFPTHTVEFFRPLLFATLSRRFPSGTILGRW
jgi:hypothetical protein